MYVLTFHSPILVRTCPRPPAPPGPAPSRRRRRDRPAGHLQRKIFTCACPVRTACPAPTLFSAPAMRRPRGVCGPDGVLLAGATGRRDVETPVGTARRGRGARRPCRRGTKKIIAAIDTPAGALAAAQLPGCSARLAGLVFDGEALAGVLGPGALAAARGGVLLAAAAGGSWRSTARSGCTATLSHAACKAARAEGFSGKAALDAPQAETVAAVFAGPHGQSIDKPPRSGHRSAR